MTAPDWPTPDEYYLDPMQQKEMGLTLEEGDRLHTSMVPYSFPLTDFVVVEVEDDGVAVLWPADEAVAIEGWEAVAMRGWAS